MQFLAALPTTVLHQYVMQLQSLLTINIVAGGNVNMDLLMSCVRMLDIFYWINIRFRDAVDQIEKKEFHNDAVNNNINLGPSIKDWSNRTKVQVRNHQKITHATTFNLCSYHWIMNPHNKSKMLQTYNKIEWLFNSDFFLLRSFWDPSQR